MEEEIFIKEQRAKFREKSLGRGDSISQYVRWIHVILEYLVDHLFEGMKVTRSDQRIVEMEAPVRDVNGLKQLGAFK